ncbi:MAG: SIMPL domain-containing protein [Nocardioides sp.]|nr:SIMPL domain-containing protein [Nocardioidaceae bacterium]MCB8956105.1 SIMPL domain-containing protein [Nocardioides sp.]
MRTVTVVGHGAASVVPDAAVVHLAATHRAASLAEALAGAESAREQVVAVARRFTDRIASQHLSVGPDGGEDDGYQARHALLIRCAGLDEAGALVTALAEEVGARLSVDHVGLEVSDTTDAERLAREAAFADAREKAEHLAAQAVGTLGQVESVAEGGMGGSPRFARAVPVAAAAFEPGETTVEQLLTVTFELH